MPEIVFDVAYQWLHQFEPDVEFLSPGVRVLVQTLHDRVWENRYDEATSLINRLRGLGNKTANETEVAEILVECGWAAFQFEKYEAAALYLLEAAEHYETRLHEYSLVQWMRGCALWELKTNPLIGHTAAINAWERGLAGFKELAGSRARAGRNMKWYRSKAEAMKADLKCAVTDDCQPPRRSGGYVPSKNAGGAGKTAAPPSGAFLRLFTVYEEVPAGGFRASGRDPSAKAYVDVEKLEINGRMYCVISLDTDRCVRVRPGWRHEIVRVSGDSMDLAGILEGDYVLLRVQDSADPNEIVAAEIMDVDACATLKRYKQPDRQHILLKPESSNPEHTEFVFGAADPHVKICGVAVAVLKPV